MNQSDGFRQRASAMFSGLYDRDSNSSSTMNTMKYVIYALMIAIVVATAVLAVDQFYPFLPVNPISGPSAAARAGKTFWKTSGENMIVPAADSPTTLADTYTMSVQLMIGDSRTPSLGRFRHIIHRGSNPCGLSLGAGMAPGPSGHAGISANKLPADAANDPTYKSMGLPSIMNPGLFLDKLNNDLHVFMHTNGTENGSNVLMLESITIQDLPLATPITVGVVCNRTTLEVYVNCRLYSTLLLKGTPYLPPAQNQWYGLYCAFPMSGLVKNLQLWGTPLGPTDYIQLCRTGSFALGDLPSVCPVTNTDALK